LNGTPQESSAQAQAKYARLVQIVGSWAANRGLKRSQCFDYRLPPSVKVDACEGYAIPYETCGIVGCSPKKVVVTAYLVAGVSEVRLEFMDFGRATSSEAKRDAEASLLPLISEAFGNDAILVSKQSD